MLEQHVYAKSIYQKLKKFLGLEVKIEFPSQIGFGTEMMSLFSYIMTDPG